MSATPFEYGDSAPGTSAYKSPDREAITRAIAFLPGTPWSNNSGKQVTGVVLFSGPVRLLGFQGYNSGAAAFVQLLDSATIPADGAVPDESLAVAATANFSLAFGTYGRWCHRGICLVGSSTQPTKTLATAAFWFSAQYV